MTSQIAVYGAGSFGREVAWLAEQCGHEVVCFIDDGVPQGTVLNGFPVLPLARYLDEHQGVPATCAIGAPATRELVVGIAETAGLRFVTLVHPRTERSRWIEIGHGSTICAGNILTTNITIGKQVQLNLDCTVGHDAIFGDYTTVAPGVHVSGWVHFRRRCYVGTGAVIINGSREAPIVIEDDAVIGAGACVTRSVPAGATVVGVPAKPRG